MSLNTYHIDEDCHKEETDESEKHHQLAIIAFIKANNWFK